MKSLLSKVRSALTKRYVMWPAVILATVIGWQVYMNYSRALDIPSTNLISNGSFEKLDSTGNPESWTLTAPAASVTVSQTNGFVSGKSLRLDITNYKNSDVTLESSRVTAEPGRHYFFKTYYITDIASSLHIKVGYKDGTQKMMLANHYPDYDYPWSTMSGGFTANESMEWVSFVITLADNGYIEFDGAYVDNSDDEIEVQACTPEANLVPNANLAVVQDGTPVDWERYQFGNNTARHEIINESGAPFMRVTADTFTDGEAKWAYTKQPIKAHQAFCLGFEYRSTTKVDVYAEYTLSDGTITYGYLTDLLPTSTWTAVSVSGEAPKNTVSVRATVNLNKAGQLDTRSYRLGVTSQDTSTFKRPLISITFDDGWLSSYDNGARLVDEFGMKGTFYINPGYIGDDDFMHFEDLEDLVHRGHQLGSHGDFHIDLTSYTPKKVSNDLADSRRYLEKKFGLTGIDFASPYGKHDAKSDTIIRQNYASHRGTGLGINTKRNLNIYDLKVLFIRKETTRAQVQEMIDEAIASNGWFIMVYHQIENTNDEFIVDESTLRDHLQAVKNSGVQVSTVQDALRELQSQQ